MTFHHKSISATFFITINNDSLTLDVKIPKDHHKFTSLFHKTLIYFNAAALLFHYLLRLQTS